MTMWCFCFSSWGWGGKQWWPLIQLPVWSGVGKYRQTLRTWRGRHTYFNSVMIILNNIAKGIWLYWFKACPSLRLLAPSILVEPVWESLMIILWCPPQLLNRVFNIMREKNPDMVAGEKRKFVMKPPQVVRVGTKKTSFVNFTDICKLWVKHVYFIHSTDFRDLSFYILQESYSIWWLKCGSVS